VILIKATVRMIVMNLRDLPRRMPTALIAVIAVAGAVGVLVSILAMAQGLQKAVADSGRTDRAIVIHSGATSEIGSAITRDAVAKVKSAPGLRRNVDGSAIVSEEILEPVVVSRRRDGTETSIMLRGVGREAARVWPEIKISEGRMFRAGARELIAGSMARRLFRNLEVGDAISLADGPWRVVGVFESGADLHESELLADAETVLSAYHALGYSVATVALRPAGFPEFQIALDNDRSLSLQTLVESEFYGLQSRAPAQALTRIAISVGGVMGIGSVLATFAAMYALIMARARQIIILRAIGFGLTPVVIALFVETMLLTLSGAVLGAAAAWLLFNNHALAISADMGLGSVQLVFHQVVTKDLFLLSMACASVLGMISAALSAVPASKLTVSSLNSLSLEWE
jgi:putative ABC transport system permease protein